MRKMMVFALLIGAALLAVAQSEVRAGSPCVIPKSWGTLKGVTAGQLGSQQLAFEAADGTIRITSANCTNPPKPSVIERSEN